LTLQASWADYMSTLQIDLLDSFDDPRLVRHDWRGLLARGSTNTVFQTWEWQRSWWDVFGRGKLLLVLIEEDDHAIACAPLFCDGGMVFFVGSGSSDYLDFAGDVMRPDVLPAVLELARKHTPEFVGFRFYHVPDYSATGRLLQEVAAPLGLICYDEGELLAPALSISPDGLRQAVTKKSLVRHERGFRESGTLHVQHLSGGAEIRPHLDGFFDQHVARWALTCCPSLFTDPRQRQFYERLTDVAAHAGWLRFTRLDWQACPIAFHYGFSYRGRYLWYKPSFAVDLARRSPGEVLLRQVLLSAGAEDAHVFDFGLGEEMFKARFADHVELVRTWGLYPMEAQSTEQRKAGSE
jgi:CelD/BcsL family acetyltransferase involved in cellulose biosynthesis